MKRYGGRSRASAAERGGPCLALVLAAALSSTALLPSVACPRVQAEDGAAPEASAPRPRPTPEDIATQTAMIREAFAEELRENREFPLETARKFLAATRDTADPARAWALFDESARLATAARALPEAVAVATERARLFGLDPGQEIVAALKAMANQDGADLEGVSRLALAVAKDATPAEQFAVAKDALDVAAAAAASLAAAGRRPVAGQPRTPSAKVEKLRQDLQTTRAVLNERERRRAAYDAACKTLADAPDDPAANLQAGIYLCAVRGEWQQGVQRLAKSGVKEIEAAAAADTALAQADAAGVRAVVDVGERWWRIADSLPEAGDAEAFRRHVADLYGRIADQATDPIEKRLIERRREQARR